MQTRLLRSALLPLALLVSGAADAAFPTPGGEETYYHVYALGALGAQQTLDEFLAAHPSENYSLVADDRTSTLVLVGPGKVHGELRDFVAQKTKDRERRVIIDMQVMKTVDGSTEVVGNPRLEVPCGQARRLHLDGAWGQGQGPRWTSRLELTPDVKPNGKIHMAIRGGPADDLAPPVTLDVDPGQPVLIDPERAQDPAMKQLGKDLNQGRHGAVYTVTLTANSL